MNPLPHWPRTLRLLALLAALDLILTLPMLTAAGRPFGWANLEDGPVYEILSIRRSGTTVTVSAAVASNRLYTLQRNTNGLAPSAWEPLVVLNAHSNTITVVDAQAPAKWAAYRVSTW